MTKTEQVYGGALYDLAKEEGLAEQIYEQLQQLIALFDETPEYLRFLATFSIPMQDRCKALDEAFGSVQPYLKNFLKLLCENGTIGQFKGCAKEYRNRYYADNDIVEVCAVTAIELKAPLREALTNRLNELLNKKVELTTRIDPSCMGGVRLELPGRNLDGTIRSRLDTISRDLRTLTI